MGSPGRTKAKEGLNTEEVFGRIWAAVILLYANMYKPEVVARYNEIRGNLVRFEIDCRRGVPAEDESLQEYVTLTMPNILIFCYFKEPFIRQMWDIANAEADKLVDKQKSSNQAK